MTREELSKKLCLLENGEEFKYCHLIINKNNDKLYVRTNVSTMKYELAKPPHKQYIHIDKYYNNLAIYIMEDLQNWNTNLKEKK